MPKFICNECGCEQPSHASFCSVTVKLEVERLVDYYAPRDKRKELRDELMDLVRIGEFRGARHLNIR